jgi:mannose-1-phosphate guanylyltransferase/mannose-6-phosphate isomerase
MVNFVILCGGSGSRLWPKSREKFPKQLLRLTNEYSMLQNTVFRILYLVKECKKNDDISNDNKFFIICNKEHGYIIETQINELSCSIDYQIICEPKGRDSAPAICISALLGNIEDNTIILPCDHIFDNKEFLKCYNESLVYINDYLITFGIKPTKIETGYGYIKVDENNNTIQFIEKPNYETAKMYYEDGTYLWNAGIFAFKNKYMLNCFEKYAKDIYDNCYETIHNTDVSNKLVTLKELPFINCRCISVDYAIMEKLCSDEESILNKKTILYNSTWNDIGNYSALYQELNKDYDGNIIKGDCLTINTQNCYIDSEHCLTTVIGGKDLIVVNTDDALLICDIENTQDIKKIVDYLKLEKRDEYIIHKTVFRPWGWYKNVEGNDHNGFKIKRIAVYPGKRLSLQSHNKRSEHWVIVKGSAKVQLGDDILFLNKDQNVYIPVQTLHRIENIGNELLEFTETQIGEYLGEDDIIRYEDDFGRK